MTNPVNAVRLSKGILVACVMQVLFLAGGCGGKRQEVFTPHRFPVPDIPSVVASEYEASEFLALHYWDDYTDTSEFYPSDSSIVNGVRESDLEQAFADWIAVLDRVEPEAAEKAVSVLFDRISACEARDTASSIFETVSGLAEKYLYDPNSPMRNEDLYLPFVSRLASYGGIPEGQRMRYEYDAKMCSLNRRGTPAADFSFCDKNGRIRTLHSLEADYTLLFFSNPGCEACKYIIDRLKSDSVLSDLISSGKVAVANIYIDEDLKSWYGYQKIYPAEWYNGYDPGFIIRTDLLYNVRAIPSLYLLDKDKNVLLKDAPEERIFAALRSIAAGQ